MVVNSPYKVVEVLFQRKYLGYLYRRELVDTSEFGDDENMEMVNCYSDFSGDWIGDSRTARLLCKKKGIRFIQKTDPDHCVCSIGFNPEEQKWYGWSHRAIFGFGIGSTVKKGDCGYVASTPQALFESITTEDDDGWAWQKPEDVEIIEDGIKIRHKMVKHTSEDPETGELLGFVDAGYNYQIIKCGKGEWVAETLEDAKQMAIDFAEGVS